MLTRQDTPIMETRGRLHLSKALLVLAAVVCFAELANVPWHGPLINVFDTEEDPGPWATAVWGFLLVRRALVVKDPPAVVLVSGCFVAALAEASNHGLLNINKPVYMVLLLVPAACFAFWERVAKLWTPKSKLSPPGK